MTRQRRDGDIHPGLKWGPFITRIPLYHTRIEWPEFFQGAVITMSTCMALAPLLMASFGLSFAEAITMSMLHFLLVSSGPILFGEPYAGGWITPALPLTLVFVMASADDPTSRFQMMTALSIDLAMILFALGITGLGQRFIAWMPMTIKAGIILGAALAAFKRVFHDDYDRLYSAPIATTCAIVICLLFSFSIPIKKLKAKSKVFAWVGNLGLLPGFAVAALIGWLVGEIQYDVVPGLLLPEFSSLWAKVSPFVIGWPTLDMFITALPLALIAYIILFGDVITGMEIVKGAKDNRPDEEVDLNTNRTHLSLAIRNFIMALVAPFFSSQGCLWTGVQVVVVQRWKEGRSAMDSIYSGISSYYLFGLPLLMMFSPWVTFLKPLLWVALSLTLVLTGFACAGIALAMPKCTTERGAVFMTAISLALFQPWVGLLIGFACAFLLLGYGGRQAQKASKPIKQEESGVAAVVPTVR